MHRDVLVSVRGRAAGSLVAAVGDPLLCLYARAELPGPVYPWTGRAGLPPRGRPDETSTVMTVHRVTRRAGRLAGHAGDRLADRYATVLLGGMFGCGVGNSSGVMPAGRRGTRPVGGHACQEGWACRVSGVVATIPWHETSIRMVSRPPSGAVRGGVASMGWLVLSMGIDTRPAG